MSVAQLVDFKRTGREYSSRPGGSRGRRYTALLYNVLQRECRPQNGDRIWGSAVHEMHYLNEKD